MTNLYLTTVAADAQVTVSGGAGGSQTKWEAGWSAGAASRSVVKQNQNPRVTTVQMTDGTGTLQSANYVAWYTERLNAVTITGTITCTMWDREVSTSTNALACIVVELVSADGTFIGTIHTVRALGAEMVTVAGGAVSTVTMTAANVVDTTIDEGERLRISLWMTSTALTTTTTHYAQFYVNGPTGSAGSSQLAFTESLSAFTGFAGDAAPALTVAVAAAGGRVWAGAAPVGVSAAVAADGWAGLKTALAYGASAAGLTGGDGTWVNPSYAAGAGEPDSAYATWAVPS